jgi:serine/threonine-protein kinase
MSDDTRERLREFFADRYALGDEIERGGMAVVYAAEDLKHRRTVAIKVLLPTIAASMGAERFLREIGLVARLQHPNILTLIDSGQANG